MIPKWTAEAELRSSDIPCHCGFFFSLRVLSNQGDQMSDIAAVALLMVQLFDHFSTFRSIKTLWEQKLRCYHAVAQPVVFGGGAPKPRSQRRFKVDSKVQRLKYFLSTRIWLKQAAGFRPPKLQYHYIKHQGSKPQKVEFPLCQATLINCPWKRSRSFRSPLLFTNSWTNFSSRHLATYFHSRMWLSFLVTCMASISSCHFFPWIVVCLLLISVFFHSCGLITALKLVQSSPKSCAPTHHLTISSQQIE